MAQSTRGAWMKEVNVNRCPRISEESALAPTAHDAYSEDGDGGQEVVEDGLGIQARAIIQMASDEGPVGTARYATQKRVRWLLLLKCSTSGIATTP